MKVTRLDLDGTGSPGGLVTKILQAEPSLPIPVPIEELAAQLDIGEIAELETEGFEGGLLTDDTRSFGGILIREGMDRRRRRFTIGHELGHFLIITHRPARLGQFLCTKGDMREWSMSEQNRAARMEAEANRFSAGILMPPPHLRTFLRGTDEPSLQQLLELHEYFDVSRETAARAYSAHHGAKIAMVVARNSKALRIYKAPTFPRMCIVPGDPLPRYSIPIDCAVGETSGIHTAESGRWLETKWGTPVPQLFQQVLIQKNGFALLMLWCDEEDEEDLDPDEDKTAKERYRDRLAARSQY